MKYLLLTFICFTTLFSCKKEIDYLVKYNFRYSPDSLNQSYKLTEEMVLRTNDKGFVFMTNNAFSLDTLGGLTTLEKVGNILENSNLVKRNEFNKYRIYFEKDSSHYFFKTQANSFWYNFKDEVPEIKWELINETKKINEFDVKKATTNLFGRNWIAWYAEDIKVPYGPYKFNGLPGLILELNDDKNYFHYEAISVVKDTANYPIYEKYNEINSKRIEFETAIKAYKENPVKINMRTGDDTKRDTELLEKRKHELKAKNNSIEKGLQFDL